MVTVLIADPDEDTRMILAAALRHEAFAVLEAADAETAQQLARTKPLDLIIVNYPMRLPSGVTLTRAVRELAGLSRLPIVNFTSHATEETLIDAQNDGVTRTLPKPAHVPTVMETIRALTDPELILRGAKSRREGGSLARHC